jgi:hypothetical protein
MDGRGVLSTERGGKVIFKKKRGKVDKKIEKKLKGRKS